MSKRKIKKEEIAMPYHTGKKKKKKKKMKKGKKK